MVGETLAGANEVGTGVGTRRASKSEDPASLATRWPAKKYALPPGSEEGERGMGLRDTLSKGADAARSQAQQHMEQRAENRAEQSAVEAAHIRSHRCRSGSTRSSGSATTSRRGCSAVSGWSRSLTPKARRVGSSSRSTKSARTFKRRLA